MAKPKRTREPAAPAQRAPSRVAIVLAGAVLGAAWGSIMWLIFELAGRESGVRGWAYLAITMAMIGAGVAAIFGAGAARRRGERLGPRLPFGRRRDR
ncbi:hypothetical protein [Miltoncostaea marina]|uniref:hypothetical protein n=1 Tax=Miltoncostaea marina TaxID=2843215 RepID=UPI001C3E5942|nr:hypothetical protein [Miltoncostaea marina]